MNISSYPSIYSLGHRAVKDLFDGDVIVEEKIDGSQFSFGVVDGVIRMRSKGQEVHELQPDGMFKKAVETVKQLAPKLRDGYVYRGEYLSKPKHSVLAYDRHPNGHIIIFDIQTAPETYLGPEDKQAEADRLGLECVPTLYRGRVSSSDSLRGLLETESVLGGQKIEGFVVKPMNYDKFGTDKKCLLGKYVSEAFKEVHQKTWTKEHRAAGGKDFLGMLANEYNTQARWSKAVLHLTEAGALESSPRDIGILIGEVPKDIEKECTDEIKEKLFKWAWPQLRRMVTSGLPEWYKEELLKKQFEVTSE